jgi:hypothetical protein
MKSLQYIKIRFLKINITYLLKSSQVNSHVELQSKADVSKTCYFPIIGVWVYQRKL